MLRRSIRDLLDGTSPPDDRRAALARMKETLVAARIGISDLRSSVHQTRARLEMERRELETVQRRKRFASEIQDAETVAIAERYERQHGERVGVLTRKLEAQEAELALAETEVQAMTAELKSAATQWVGSSGGPMATSPLRDVESELQSELEQLDRSRTRAASELDAQRKLDEMKRRMGK